MKPLIVSEPGPHLRAVNLRTPGEQRAGAEEEAVRAQGLRYVSVPVDSATYATTVKAFHRVAGEMSASPKP